MPTQIVWPQFDTHQLSGFGNDYPRTFIGNRENPILRALADFQSVLAKPIGCLLGDEYDFVLPAAFGLLQDQFAILEVPQPELQHFADPHTALGHQFQHEPITGFRSLKRTSSTVSFSMISRFEATRCR